MEDGRQSLETDLTKQIKPLMETLQIPGAAVGIIHGDRELLLGFGVTSVYNPLEVTPATLFQIGSITKTYTATALMRLADKGALDLDAPIQTYIATFSLENAYWEIVVTPRHLLTHTAGWEGDYLLSNPIGGRGDDALQRAVDSMPMVPLHTQPGTVYHYNNMAFSVAGRLLEVLTDKTYETALRDLVLEPLGLDESFLFVEQILPHRFAIGHTHTSANEIEPAQWWAYRCNSSAGGLVSSANDLLEYARFHLGDGVAASKRLLQSESLSAMQTPQFQVGDRPSAVGLSWMINDVGGEKAISHVGSSNGQFAMLQMVPKHEIALVILTNADTGLIFAPQIAAWVIERLTGAREAELEPIQMQTSDLEEYVGTYVGETFVVHVALADSAHLQATANFKNAPDGWELGGGLPPVPVSFYRKDAGVVREGIFRSMQPRFLRDNDGEIEWLRFNERLHRLQRQ